MSRTHDWFSKPLPFQQPVPFSSGTHQNRLPEASGSQLGRIDRQDAPETPPDGRKTLPGLPEELPRTPSRPYLGAILASQTRPRPSKTPPEAAKIASGRSESLFGRVVEAISDVKQPQDWPNGLPRALTVQVGTSKNIDVPFTNRSFALDVFDLLV